MEIINASKRLILANLRENILLVMDVNEIKMDIIGLREGLMIASMCLDIF